MDRQEQKAHQSVTALHQWIETVFTGGADASDKLRQLMDSFSPDFSMITIKGQKIGLKEVEMLFHSQLGARPQLKILIDSCETLFHSHDSVLCRYRETHYNGEMVIVRWSTALIDIHGEQPRWRYLHETAEAVPV